MVAIGGWCRNAQLGSSTNLIPAPDLVAAKASCQRSSGTTAWAPFVAAFRNAFRLTYGFGFIYDKNFNTDDQQTR
jgi:hypothetical protein